MNIQKDFKEFIELLNANRVKYLVVGGYAVSFYSQPKLTQDIDFWIGTGKQNARRVLHVLKEFGFGSSDISFDDLINPDMVIQLGNPPMRIDLITAISGGNFTQAYTRRVIGNYFGVRVAFINKVDLIKNKQSTGRKKDLYDIEWIKKYSKSKK
jgi:hypothetical protein